MENVKTCQLCANPFTTQENTKDGRCIQQTTSFFYLLTTSLQLSTKLLTLYMRRQNTLRNITNISVSKENRIKNSCFQDSREKLERKDSVGLEIVALISGGLI